MEIEVLLVISGAITVEFDVPPLSHSALIGATPTSTTASDDIIISLQLT